MKIALIIGVSHYHRANSLPACKQDAAAIEGLLKETRSFDHRLCLSGDLAAQDTKVTVLSFLDSFRGQRISQFLFYFSGHGTLQNGDLLYLLSDFDEKRPRQTSIENGEVDSWLRDLAPDVAVKITDCCNSGMPYLKDPAMAESAVARSKGQFSTCYFLAASHADEATCAGENLSEFTEHVLRGLSERDLGSIRYRDLIDSVLDRYRDNNSQRPYVVQQGGMRDTFFEQTEETRSLLKKLVGPKVDPVPEPIPEEPQIKRSLIELIEADAKGMITKQSAASHLMMLQKSTENLQVDEELKGVYVLSSEFSRAWEIDIANEETVAKWIKRRHDLFAEAVEEEIKTRVPHHLLDPIEAHMNPFGKIEKKKEITCFRVTSNLTYDFIKLQLEPQYSNLAKYEAAFLLLWSRRDAVLFWYVTPLKTINWSEHELPDQIRWKVRTFPAPELGSIGQSVLQIFWEMEELAKNDLKRFQPVKETV